MKVVFLCLEPSGYLFDSIKLIQSRQNLDIQVFHLPVPSIAPFELKNYDSLSLTEICHESKYIDILKQLNFDPDALIIAGWFLKSYLKIGYKYRKLGKSVILMCDNPWTGSIKQRAFSSIFRKIILVIFTHAWIPGYKQYYYMRKLGFSHDKILKNLYTANNEVFYPIVKNVESNKDKYLLFSGRLVEYKGILNIYNAFNSLPHSIKGNWKLKIIGNGPLESKLKDTSDIEVICFSQPKELANIMRQSHAFILASNEEAWGVSVHEAVCCGLPLLLSSGVNSREYFLRSGENGFLLKDNSAEQIKLGMIKLFQCDDNKLYKMSQQSLALSQAISREYFVSELLSVLNEN